MAKSSFYTDGGTTSENVDSITSLSNEATASKDAAAVSEAAALVSQNAAAASASSITGAVTSSQTAQAAAETAEAAAETAQTAAATSASQSASSSVTSANSATASTTSATASAASATASETSKTASETAKTASQTAQAASELALDNFTDQYLGAHSSNRTTDLDGNTLVVGTLMYNTSDNNMKVYSGSAWNNTFASLTGTLQISNNLSDLNNTSTARSNLGVAIGGQVQAHSSVLDATTASYTTALNTKLNAIEASATADQTAAQILTAVKTVDGASSGLDSDLLDGQHGAYYAPIASPTFTGNPIAVTQSAGNNSTRIATTAYTDVAIANLADSAPSTLNTLNELAAALGDDANFSTTVTNSIAAKLPLAGGTMTGDLRLNDGVELELGDSAEFRIKHHASGYTHLENTVGTLFIDSDSVTFRDDDGSPTNLLVNQSGISVTGTVTATTLQTTAGGTVTTASGNDLNIVYPDTRSLFFKEGSTTTLTLDNAQNATFAGAVTIGNTYLSNNYASFANLRINNNAYIGSVANPQVIQIQTSGHAVFGAGLTSSGTVKVSKASSGATATSGTVLTIEDDDNTELSILGGSSSVLAINFGHSGDNDDGNINYNTTPGSEQMAFRVNAADRLTINKDGNSTFGGTGNFAGAVTVGNSFVGSNSSHLANITVNNNGYIGSANATTALQIPTSGGLNVNGNSTFAGTVTVDGGTSSSLIIEKDATGGAAVRFHNAGSQISYIQLDADENMTHYGASGVDQIFYAHGAEVLTLTSGNSTFAGTVTAKVPQTANTVMPVVKITTSGTYNSSGSANAGGALSFGQYDNSYPAWNLGQIAGIRNGSGWSGNLLFYTNSGSSQTNITEKARLDADGNLFLGSTINVFTAADEYGYNFYAGGQANYSIDGTSASSSVLYLNRENGDGVFTRFYKDRAEVGSIGSD